MVKGGRRFSFSALTVVGNRNGLVGIGYGKGREVPMAIEKSVKDARKNLMRVTREGTTIPHAVDGKYCSTTVRLVPAASITYRGGVPCQGLSNAKGVRPCSAPCCTRLRLPAHPPRPRWTCGGAAPLGCRVSL